MTDKQKSKVKLVADCIGEALNTALFIITTGRLENHIKANEKEIRQMRDQIAALEGELKRVNNMVINNETHAAHNVTNIVTNNDMVKNGNETVNTMNHEPSGPSPIRLSMRILDANGRYRAQVNLCGEDFHADTEHLNNTILYAEELLRKQSKPVMKMSVVSNRTGAVYDICFDPLHGYPCAYVEYLTDQDRKLHPDPSRARNKNGISTNNAGEFILNFDGKRENGYSYTDNDAAK